MRTRLKKYWFPVVVILLATIQTFATEIHRGAVLASIVEEIRRPDTVIYNNSSVYTKYRTDRTAGEEGEDGFQLEENGTMVSARDTIKVPDSLRLTDPFRYKYYVALVDSLTHHQVKDSLIAAGDSLDWPKIDSIYFADSAIAAKIRFEQWYAGLDKFDRKKYDYEQKMAAQKRKADSTFAVKDSIKNRRDSIREATPRILESFAVADSMHYKRIFTWNVDRYFNNVKARDIDTSYNYWFNDYKFMREDVNVSYLGIAGSPVQYYDFSKRYAEEGVSFYEPYEVYSFSPATAPMYNTKTPYTELAYWGTLFANTETEESDIHVLTTQNIYPALNMTLSYDRTGANGMLESENVNNRTAFAGLNWLGKKYNAHLGYIFNSVKKAENGGVVDNFWIRDTTVGSREVAVHLKDADNVIKKNTVYLNQTYRIPFSFLKKIGHRKDTLAADEPVEMKTMDTDVTTAFIGHNSEFSTYTKSYTDNISTSDKTAREFYNNQFFINPTKSADSLRVMKLENKVFLKLQPWADDAIVSSVNAGIGNRILSYYMFNPLGYLTEPKNTVWNSAYLYGGAAGQFKKYLSWDAQGYYTFLGNEINDFGISGNVKFSAYPFRRHRKEPLSLIGHFETTLDEPEYYQQHYYSNHLKWDNDFKKISTTKFEGTLDIPYWKLSVTAGYTQLFNNIYYDNYAVAQQNTEAMSVFKVSAMKNFRVWKLHFDNQALFQHSTNESVVPLPKLALNLRWYLQFDIVKDVLQMQLGANALYTTAWYAPAYSPELGQFHNQDKEKYGDCPYIDAFVNMQWKRACIFVKMVNANMGWPMNSADYFSAAGFIRPQRAVKFGIWWPFYVQPGKKSASSSSAGSGSARPQGSPTRSGNSSRSSSGSNSFRQAASL